MHGAKVGVLEEAHEVGLGGFLEGEDGTALEAQVALEVLRNLPDQALEWEHADQQLGGSLVLADLAQCHGARAVAVGLAHGPLVPSRLGGQLLPRRLPARRLASRLLGAGHLFRRVRTTPVRLCAGSERCRRVRAGRFREGRRGVLYDA